MSRRRANHLGGWSPLQCDGGELYARRDFRAFGLSNSESKESDERNDGVVLSLGSFREAF